MAKRLEPFISPPLMVAFSGGGDSLFLLHASRTWARAIGRRLVVVTVDHGLQAQSPAWTRWCRQKASRLGLEHRSLCWNGPKPNSVSPAAARAARHDLIAGAARAAGARVILMGHTADDVLEARLMREAGARVPEPRSWSPSPAWPEGRGLFILRPLIGLRRQETRDALAGLGETWIEDPANEDTRCARARARLALIANPGLQAPVAVRGLEARAPSWPPLDCDGAGVITISRSAVADMRPAAGRRLVGAALLCAAGGSRPARSVALSRLVARLVGGETFVTTLCGARLEANARLVRFMRDAGEVTRRAPPATVSLPCGEPIVWDGRFEIEARQRLLQLRPLGGVAAGLGASARARLRAIPASARAALPAILEPGGNVICPVAEDGPARVRCLVSPRLRGALGWVSSEAEAAPHGASPCDTLDLPIDRTARRVHEPA
jgi:tRNA(Ile)-lysidine synthase